MITEQTEAEKDSLANEDLTFENESIDIDMERTEPPKTSWFVHHVVKHLLPFLKD
jgi:hypothetical protein